MTHDAFVRKALRYFPGTIVSEPSYADYKRHAIAHLEKAFGAGTKTQQYERSIEFLGQLAERRTGREREMALRLRDELHATLTTHRRNKSC